MEVFIEPVSYTIDFPDASKAKYPAAVMRFMDHRGNLVTMKMSQEKFDEFVLRLTNREDK